MKNIYPYARLLSAAIFFSLLFIGCKKEKSDTLSDDQEKEALNFSSQSETETEIVFNDVFDNVMGVNTDLGIGGTGIFGRMAATGTVREERDMNVDTLPSCVTVTITRTNLPDLFPVRVVMDFGSGCISNNHTRSGKIITTYTGRLVVPGSSATTTFEHFKIDSFSVEGTHKVTNTTAAGSNQRQFSVNVYDARITKPNGDYSQWESERVTTQIEGNGTLLPQDDIFRIQGAAHGRVKHGNLLYAWRSEIVEPLIKKFFCRWISKGTIRVRRETLPASSPWVAELNYGSGACDFLATLTINSLPPRPIELPH